MPLTLIGIDEAGYGPLLGPLTVGMVALRVNDWSPGDRAPDLWNALARGVCRSPSDKHKRIAVDDSKKLKRPNDGKGHPLTHLERGVMGFMMCREACNPPDDDGDLFATLGVEVADMPWYGGDPMPLPVGSALSEIRFAANDLRHALAGAQIEILDLRCACAFEGEFNEIVNETGTKASVTGRLISSHLRRVWSAWSEGCGAEDGPRVVCDRQSGRKVYRNLIAGAIPDAEIIAQEETPQRSRYRVQTDERAASVFFEPEADGNHLVVALASMIAKYVRELIMGRFNRYWCARMPELKPTAGYRTDAHRWLKDVESTITDRDRASMIRIA